jgi:hypothetical protein
MGLKIFQVHKFQSGNVGRFENHLWGHPCFESFFPSKYAQAPLVTGFEPRKLILRDRSG